MKIKLSKKYNFGGKEFEELEINIEDMKGKDFLACEKEFKARNKDAGIIKELEDSWAISVAAKAVGVKYGDLIELESVDYLKVVNKVRLFLSKGWEEKEETKADTKDLTEEITA